MLLYPGVVVMSHVHGHASTMRHRILELELTDDWLGALQEYDLILNSPHFSDSLQHYKTLAAAPTSAASGLPCAGAVATNDADAVARTLLPIDTIAKLERQKLRCMIELGQCEAVIEQTSSLSLRVTELQSALLPLATEASWRLMRWNDLETFLSTHDRSSQSRGPSSSPTGDETANSVSMTMVDPSLPMLDTDLFQLSVGKLVLAMYKRDTPAFHRELENARKQVCMSYDYMLTPPPPLLLLLIYPLTTTTAWYDRRCLLSPRRAWSPTGGLIPC